MIFPLISRFLYLLYNDASRILNTLNLVWQVDTKHKYFVFMLRTLEVNSCKKKEIATDFFRKLRRKRDFQF